jgi:hypothetical protein
LLEKQVANIIWSLGKHYEDPERPPRTASSLGESSSPSPVWQISHIVDDLRGDLRKLERDMRKVYPFKEVVEKYCITWNNGDVEQVLHKYLDDDRGTVKDCHPPRQGEVWHDGDGGTWNLEHARLVQLVDTEIRELKGKLNDN